MLSGQVIGQLANLSAAPHIRSGRLAPLLLQHLSEHIGLHVYYGSRESVPRRVRAFIDLVLARLSNDPAIVLSAQELTTASLARKRGRRI